LNNIKNYKKNFIYTKKIIKQKIVKDYFTINDYIQFRLDQQVAMINIEQSSPPLQPHLSAVQQAAESNDW
jgi:hypothetical protein